MERKFTRGLNKLGSAVQMRENVSQLVRESAVLVSFWIPLLHLTIAISLPPLVLSQFYFFVFRTAVVAFRKLYTYVYFCVGVSPVMHVTFCLVYLPFWYFLSQSVGYLYAGIKIKRKM